MKTILCFVIFLFTASYSLEIVYNSQNQSFEITNRITFDCGNQDCMCCGNAKSCICKENFVDKIKIFEDVCKKHVCIVTNNSDLVLPNGTRKCTEDHLGVLASVERKGNTYSCNSTLPCAFLDEDCITTLSSKQQPKQHLSATDITPDLNNITFEQQLKIISTNSDELEDIELNITRIWELVFKKLKIQFPCEPDYVREIRGRDGKIFGLRYVISGANITAKQLLRQYRQEAKKNNELWQKTISFPRQVKSCNNTCKKSMKCGEQAKVDLVFGQFICQCKLGYVGDPNIKCIGICQEEEITTTAKGDLTFAETFAGLTSLSKQTCPNGYPLASVTCNNSAPFEFSNDILFFNCGVDIHAVLDMAYNDSLSVEIACSYLQILTANSNDLSSKEVNSVVNFMENVTNNVNEGRVEVSSVNVLRSLVLISSQLAEGYWKPDRSKKAMESPEFRASDNELRRRIATYIPELAIRSNVFKDNGDMFVMETDALYMQITQSTNATSNGTFSFQPIIRTNNGSTEESPVTLIVPSEVTERAWSNENATTLTQRRTCFILYKSDTFLHTARNISYVLSVNIGINVKLDNLQQPIKMIHEDFNYTKNFKPFENSTKILRQKPKCVFWDFEQEMWSEKGCYYKIGSNPPECNCNHLTNFAVLVVTELDTKDIPLSTVTIVGCSLSIAGLIFTSLVIAASRDLRKTRSGKILLNICINLALSYIVFVTGVSAYKIEWACILITALLHFFFLITWFWMAIYSYDMYNSLVKVFSSYQTKFMLRGGIVAYGVPLIIVITTFSVTVGQQIYNGIDLIPSSYHRENVCWLLDVPLYASFLAPVGILLCFNCFVFVVVTWELYKQNKKAQSDALKRTTKQSLLISSTMTFIMGITWVFGYLMLISTNSFYLQVMSWLFAITNAFQGVGIFVLTTLRRDDMRKVWWTPLKQLCFRSEVQNEHISLRNSSTSTATSKLSSRK